MNERIRKTEARSILVEARGVIERLGWCKGTYARNEAGEACYVEPESRPCAFCVVGALMFVTARDGRQRSSLEMAEAEVTRIMRETVAAQAGGHDDGASAKLLPAWNDEQADKGAILSLLSTTIERGIS
jgi:hypothetical protein